MSKLKGKIAGSLVAAGAFLYALPIYAATGGIFDEPQTQSTGLDIAGIKKLLSTVVDWLVIIGVVIAAIFIVTGGLKYMFAGGESEKADKAKTQLLNCIIGLAIVLGVYLIINTVLKLLGSGSELYN